MELRNLSQTFWIAVSAIAGAVVAGATVFQLLSPTPIAFSTLVADQSVLTGKIESFPYKHAASGLYEGVKEWRESWADSMEEALKARNFDSDQLKTVIAVMEDIVRDRFDHEIQFYDFGIARAQRWYSVTIRNEGNVPLKGVFLKFPAARYWIDERDRLSSSPMRIEIGEMDQKSEKHFVFWGGGYNIYSEGENIVLGHAAGIGNIDFE